MMLAAAIADLRSESAALDELVGDLTAEQWRLSTPAEGWSIADTISHLGSSDDAALRAIEDSAAFVRWLGEEVAPDVQGYLDSHVDPARSLPPTELLAWWRERRDSLAAAMEGLDPGSRIAWFGPAMSPLSFVTARLMETWAHGVDVTDALGLTPMTSERLRHVCEIGVRTRGWSYAVRGLVAPEAPVRVELDGPGGRWTWGPADATDRVTGDALAFCLLVTQRRHRADVQLATQGAAAEEWLGIAQAFAGPPGPGRAPLASKGDGPELSSGRAAAGSVQ